MDVNTILSPRERVQHVLHHKKPDVLPWIEDIMHENLINWSKEGLDITKLIDIQYEAEGFLFSNFPMVKGFDPYTYFGCLGLFTQFMPVDVGPIPRFKYRVLKETKKHLDVRTETGTIARRQKTGNRIWYNMPMFREFPVKDMNTWEQYKERLNPHDIRRYPKDWDTEEYLQAYQAYQKAPISLGLTGFYGFGAQLMGITSFITGFYDNPELIQTMLEYWEYYMLETLRPAIETLKDQIDYIYWWEDIANSHGPLISPRLFQKYLVPVYKRITAVLRKNQITRIMFDSDGNINPLLDLIIESGMTGLWPLEVHAGMDAVKVQKQYGKKLFLIGNLDKYKLSQGGKIMRNEVDRTLPILKDAGGYIPGADHTIPAEFTLKRFQEYRDYLMQYLPY